jgi:hypothetical protein
MPFRLPLSEFGTTAWGGKSKGTLLVSEFLAFCLVTPVDALLNSTPQLPADVAQLGQSDTN